MPGIVKPFRATNEGFCTAFFVSPAAVWSPDQRQLNTLLNGITTAVWFPNQRVNGGGSEREWNNVLDQLKYIDTFYR